MGKNQCLTTSSRAFSSNLLCVIIVWSHLHFSKHFQIVHNFCSHFQIFCCSFSVNFLCKILLSRIGLVLYGIYFSFDIFWGSWHCFSSPNYFHMIKFNRLYFSKCSFTNCESTTSIWKNINVKKTWDVPT